MAESVKGSTVEPDLSVSELDDAIWSVVSFERCEASDLTFAQAVEKMRELDENKVAGLCVVTNDAAARVSAG